MLGRGGHGAGDRDRAEPRASGDLALHVLEIMEAIMEAGASAQAVAVPAGSPQSAALSEADAAALQS